MVASRLLSSILCEYSSAKIGLRFEVRLKIEKVRSNIRPNKKNTW
jgi:hypothetical protein